MKITTRGAKALGPTLCLASTLLPGCAPKTENAGGPGNPPASAPQAGGMEANRPDAAPAPTQTASNAVSAGQAGGEVEAVKETLRKMSEADSLGEMTDYVTDESATMLGVVMMIPLAMAVSMSEMAGGMAQNMPGAQQGGAGKPPPIDPQIKADFEALQKKYGMDSAQGPGSPEVEAKLKGKGRQLVADVEALMKRLDKDGKQNSFKPNKLDKSPDDFDYKVVSATEVTITPKQGNDKAIKAVVEDGKWRLHIGSLKDAMGQMGGGPGGPGMGGGMPGMGAPPGMGGGPGGPGMGMPPGAPGPGGIPGGR